MEAKQCSCSWEPVSSLCSPLARGRQDRPTISRLALRHIRQEQPDTRYFSKNCRGTAMARYKIGLWVGTGHHYDEGCHLCREGPI